MATSVFSVGESSKVLTLMGQGSLTYATTRTICRQTASSGIFILVPKTGSNTSDPITISIDGLRVTPSNGVATSAELVGGYYDLRPFIAATTYSNTTSEATFGKMYHNILRFPFGHSLDVSVSDDTGTIWAYALYLYV